jgi:hypothetical protein
MVQTSLFGVSTTDYTYNGNKIITATMTNNGASGGVINYTYNGDLLTKSETYLNNNLTEKKLLTYSNDNNLISYIHLKYTQQTGKKITVDYNTDGTITTKTYNGDLVNQANLVSTKIISFSNGETSTLIETAGTTTTTSTFTYDNKNNPFKNIAGNSRILNAVLATSTGIAGNIYNVLQVTKSQSGLPNATNSYQHVYNSLGYPTKTTLTPANSSYNTVIDYTY